MEITIKRTDTFVTFSIEPLQTEDISGNQVQVTSVTVDMDPVLADRMPPSFKGVRLNKNGSIRAGSYGQVHPLPLQTEVIETAVREALVKPVLEALRACAHESKVGDFETAHGKAHDALLAHINDPAVTEAFEAGTYHCA